MYLSQWCCHLTRAKWLLKVILLWCYCSRPNFNCSRLLCISDNGNAYNYDTVNHLPYNLVIKILKINTMLDSFVWCEHSANCDNVFTLFRSIWLYIKLNWRSKCLFLFVCGWVWRQSSTAITCPQLSTNISSMCFNTITIIVTTTAVWLL